MKELDFLPQSYHEAVWRRVHTRRNVLMCIGLGMAMACLHGLNLTRISSAEAALTGLRNGSGGWQSARSQFTALEDKKEILPAASRPAQPVEDVAPLDAAIGEAARLLSESMALTGALHRCRRDR